MGLAAPSMRLFGVPTLRFGDGRELVLSGERPHQVLAMLACRQGWMARAELAELLWPERPPGIARSNLRKVLLLTQRLLGPAMPVLEQNGDMLRWTPDSDLRRFEAACAANDAEQALVCYRPPLLQGFDAGLTAAGLEWLAFERERVAARWRIQATTRLRELDAAGADTSEVAQALWLADPDDEAALAALARARLDAGDAAGAARALRSHRQRLTDELGVEPSAVLRALADEAVRGAPAVEPMAAPASALVGRRLESMQLRDWLLREERRVVTLTGPGGIGKSTLARAVLAEASSHYDGRAWWLALEALQHAGEVLPRIAAALSAAPPERGEADPQRQIERHLGDHRALLVLDNTEHLDGLAQILAPLLAACPRLQILNASRSRLHIEGEWLMPLEGLPLPDLDETQVELLRRNDAVRLFEARARPAAPAFDLARHAADVVRFVHAVEGLPLAMELGAAWVRLLPVSEIVAELAGSLDGQAHPGGARSARERSLVASFDVSWRLLSAPERMALAELAQLPGPFDRALAQQVARSPLPVLAALVDKSLLRAEGDGRFSMHPLLRVCAAAKLDDAGGREALAARHAAYVGHWLAHFGGPYVVPPRELAQAVERELPHVRAAWEWSLQRRDPDLVVRGALTLLQFFEIRGLWSEGLALFERAAAAFADAGRTGEPARMRALRALAGLQVRAGRFEQAEQSAREAFRLARRGGHASDAIASLTTAGLSLFSRGLYGDARPLFEQVVRRARTLGDANRLRIGIGNLAIVEQALGRYDSALALYAEVVQQSREAGETTGLIVYLNNLGEAHRGRGDWDAALAAYEEALALCERHGVRTRLGSKLVNIGITRHMLGDLAAAADWIDRALVELRATGDRSIEASTLLARATLRIDANDGAGARDDLAAGALAARSLASPDLQLRALVVHGELLWSSGEPARAAGQLAWALAQPQLYAVERVMSLHRLQRRGVDAAAIRQGADGDADARPLGRRVDDLIEELGSELPVTRTGRAGGAEARRA